MSLILSILILYICYLRFASFFNDKIKILQKEEKIQFRKKQIFFLFFKKQFR